MSTTPATYEDILRGYATHAREQTEHAKLVIKPAVFDALEKAYIGTIVIEFDGEGDSGQINEITAYAEAFEPDSEKILGKLSQVPIPDTDLEIAGVTAYLTDHIENLAYDILNSEHGGWENNDGAFGNIYFLTPSRTIRLDCNTRFSTSELTVSTF